VQLPMGLSELPYNGAGGRGKSAFLSTLTDDETVRDVTGALARTD
jgi:hypothetical protein